MDSYANRVSPIGGDSVDTPTIDNISSTDVND